MKRYFSLLPAAAASAVWSALAFAGALFLGILVMTAGAAVWTFSSAAALVLAFAWVFAGALAVFCVGAVLFGPLTYMVLKRLNADGYIAAAFIAGLEAGGASILLLGLTNVAELAPLHGAAALGGAVGGLAFRHTAERLS